ncbi:hypothetical protein, partial [Xanthomonas hortorum]|uniref:hypothetical protein n=1 Tax=Xanthomonas hortorum TaxID=56454 RepID=UPI001F1D8DE1
EDLPASLLALAQALSVTERQLHGSLLNMGVVSLICGALFRGSLRRLGEAKSTATSDKRQATSDKRQATSDKRQATSDKQSAVSVAAIAAKAAKAREKIATTQQ